MDRIKLTAFAVCLFLTACSARSEAPAHWISRGPGGGGAFYGPSISPHNPDEFFVQSDMSDYFHSTTAGRTWETLDFRQINGGNYGSSVQFTSEANVLYVLNFRLVSLLEAYTPSRSTDGGKTWQFLAGDPTGQGAYSLFADPQNTNRLVVSDYDDVYFSNNSGAGFTRIYAGSGCHVAGAFFDGTRIFVGTSAGLLVSTNNGSSFAMSGISGIPGTEAMVSFAGASQLGVTRLFCVTLGTGDVYPGVTGAEHATFLGIYKLDYDVSPQWTSAVTGIGSDEPFFVGMSRTNVNVAYVAGATAGPDVNPVVYKTVNGGGSWQKVFRAVNNENIYTGCAGYGGDKSWGFGEYALGFCVSGSDPDRAMITDMGYVHATTNGGTGWAQVYAHPDDQNPTNAPTPKGEYYHGVGLEPTTCWWLTWVDATNMFASYTDICAVRSLDRGVTWSFDYSGLSINTCYQCIKHPGSGRLYVSISSVHDLFQSTYLQDGKIDGGSGGILYSQDGGATWQTLHNFGHPVTGLGLDANNSDRLYACVVHSTAGGIFVTSNLQAGASSTWVKLANPPRTEGHPWVVQVLNDGTLVSAYSGRRNASGAFTASSGVFVSTNGGAAWLDRSHSGMQYWTKDLVVDPHDASQQKWYAGVFSGWGGAPNELGGLYRTTNRGVNWTRISSGLDRVESCAINPTNANEMFASTEVQGLWISTNAAAGLPAFQEVAAYPFQHPMRIFYNPHDTNEIWVTSFGNGMRVGRVREPQPEFLPLLWMSLSEFRMNVRGAAGQEVVLRASTNLVNWLNVATGIVFDGEVVLVDPAAGQYTRRFYRAAVP